MYVSLSNQRSYVGLFSNVFAALREGWFLPAVDPKNTLEILCASIFNRSHAFIMYASLSSQCS